MLLDAWSDDRRRVTVALATGRAGGPCLRELEVPRTVAVIDPEGPLVGFDGTCRRRCIPDGRRPPADAHEADLDPVLAALAVFEPDPTPPRHAFLDIEVDVDPERGFADPADPFAPVVAVAVWVDGRGTVLLLTPPGRRRGDVALAAGDAAVVFEDEWELLDALARHVLPMIESWSGWNSAFYDLPYLVRRLERLGLDPSALSVAGERPRPREVTRWGSRRLTYEVRGRLHLDYLDLYRRFVRREAASFALEAVARDELGEGKTPYEGTLGELWRRDPATFARYNLRDVELLARLDARHRLLDLALALAAEARVPPRAVLGTVTMIEQAVMLEARARSLVVPPRGWHRRVGDREATADTDVAGAAVLEPRRGLHRMVGCIDVNSLYPSLIRTLNASPETLVGQLDLTRTRRLLARRRRQGLGATEAAADLVGTVEYRLVCERADEPLTLHHLPLPPWLPGGSWTAPAREIAEVVLDPAVPVALSAFGTLFRTDIEGVVPGLLRRWYAERRRMQRLAGIWERLADEGLPFVGREAS